MTKQQTIELLEKQMPGFYSAQQVISLISKISEGPSSLSAGMIEKLVEALNDKIKDDLENTDSDALVDFGSASFELNGNEITLDTIDNCIEVDFEDLIRDTITDILEAPEEEEGDIVELERAEAVN